MSTKIEVEWELTQFYLVLLKRKRRILKLRLCNQIKENSARIKINRFLLLKRKLNSTLLPELNLLFYVPANSRRNQVMGEFSPSP